MRTSTHTGRRSILPRALGASRRGVTLIEIAMVIAIIGILAGTGSALMNDMIPTWRSRQAAIEFQAAVGQARTLAIADATQYRIVFDSMDSDVGVAGANVGEYRVQKGDASSDSTEWDTLPVEMSTIKVLEGEGYVNIADGAEDSLPQVSIKAFDKDLDGDGDGTTDNSLYFSPRGTLENPSGDFACDVTGDGTADGFICVTFVNKRKAVEGADESWTIIISRAGMARIQSSEAGTVGHAVGMGATTTSGGDMSGYVGPSTEEEPPS